MSAIAILAQEITEERHLPSMSAEQLVQFSSIGSVFNNIGEHIPSQLTSKDISPLGIRQLNKASERPDGLLPRPGHTVNLPQDRRSVVTKACQLISSICFAFLDLKFIIHNITSESFLI